MENELNVRIKPAITAPTDNTRTPLNREVIFVEDTNTPANNNIRIGNGTDTVNDLPNFLTLNSGGGIDYKTTLNGDSYPSTPATGATSLGEWYAPISGQPSSGSATNQILLSKGTDNNPEWTDLTLTSSTSGVFRWNSSAWELKPLQSFNNGNFNRPILTRCTNSTGNNGNRDESYFSSSAYINHSNGELTLESTNYQLKLNPSTTPFTLYNYNDSDDSWVAVSNRIITSNGLINAPNTTTDANKYLKWTGSSFSWSLTPYRTIDVADCPNYPSYTEVTILNEDSSNHLKLYGSRYVHPIAETNTDGNYTGKVTFNASMHIASLTGTSTPATGNEQTIPELLFYPGTGISFQTVSSDGRTGLRIDSSSGNIPGVASTIGDNPGLLQVTANGTPRNVFINNIYVDAIPVFYGESDDTTIWTYTDDGEVYTKDSYVDKPNSTFSGHYVNIADIVNGLIKNSKLLSLLKQALGEQKINE